MTRRGRIRHVIDSLGSGGAERLLVAYAPRLAALGFEVDVAVLHERGGNWMREKVEAAGIPVTQIDVTKLRNFRQIADFYRQMKAAKLDLIHSHLEFSSLLGSVAGRLSGTPVVTTLHTLDAPADMESGRGRRWLMYKAMETCADSVICLTEANAAIARKTGLSRASISVLPNGIEIDQFSGPAVQDRSTIRAAYGVPDDAPMIVSVCVLRPEKGLDLLIAAFPEVLRHRPDAHLLLVGDGPEMARLRGLVEVAGLQAQIHFAGYRQDVADIMKAADIFVLPTLFDAQPTVIMEAMAASLPIVATTFSGIPDMVTDGVHGTLVPPGDVAALAGALGATLADMDRARAMGTAGRLRAETEFSIARQIDKLADLYERLIAGRRRK